MLTGPGARTPALRSRLADRVAVVAGAEGDVLAAADVVVAASAGQAPAPGLLVRALGAGAIPLASELPVYTEVVEGRGLLFPPADVDVLAAQLERLIGDDALRGRLAAAVAAAGPSSRGTPSPVASRRSTRRSPRAAIRRAPTTGSAHGSPRAG